MKKYLIPAGALLLLIFSCKAPGRNDQKTPLDSENPKKAAPSATDSVKNNIDSSIHEVNKLIKDL